MSKQKVKKHFYNLSHARCAVKAGNYPPCLLLGKSQTSLGYIKLYSVSDKIKLELVNSLIGISQHTFS